MKNITRAIALTLSHNQFKIAGGAPGMAAAVFASSGMTLPDGQAQMNAELYRRIFDGRSTLGEAIRAAKAATGDADVRRTWHLFGDPTMRLK